MAVPVGTRPRYHVDAIGWYGPDLLVTREPSPGRPEFGGYRVPERGRRTVRYRSWLAGQSLTAGAVSPLRVGSERSYLVQPAAGVVVTDDDEYLDLEDLSPLRSCPGVLSWTDNEEARKPEGFEPSVRLFISADGTYAAQYRRWPQVLEVRDLLAGELSQLLGRPLADATRDDLAAVTRILGQLARRSPAAGAGAARLLHARLAYQFGSDLKTEQPAWPGRAAH